MALDFEASAEALESRGDLHALAQATALRLGLSQTEKLTRRTMSPMAQLLPTGSHHVRCGPLVVRALRVSARLWWLRPIGASTSSPS